MIFMDGEYENFHRGIPRQVTKIGLYLYYTILYFTHQCDQLLWSHDLDSCFRNHNVNPGYEVQIDKPLLCTKTVIYLF